jgi:hypothetical protein
MANYKKWLQSELDFISNNQSLLNDESLATKLSEMTGQNITKSMVRRQRRKLSIKKSRGRPKKVKPTPTDLATESV